MRFIIEIYKGEEKVNCHSCQVLQLHSINGKRKIISLKNEMQ